MSLPSPHDAPTIERLRVELAPWREGLGAIARRHGLSGAPRPEPTGTLPVFHYDDALVKLYAPASTWEPGAADDYPDFEVERAALERLSSALPIATPEVLGAGEVSSWRYVAMTRVPGRPLEQVLDGVARPAAARALHDLGRAVRALHQVDAAGLPVAVPDFDAFLEAQAKTIVDVERARGAPAEWLEPLGRFVADVPRGTRGAALLHTELGPGHALATVADGVVTLEGLIDWVEVMRGDPEYDLAVVAFFLCEGDGALLGAFLDGYGWDGPRGDTLARRLLRYLLLHRYAPLAWLLRRRPAHGARDFDALAPAWMGIA